VYTLNYTPTNLRVQSQREITTGDKRTKDRLCGLVVRVLDNRSGGPGSIPGTTRVSEKKKNENK
jgi:hypothetical protein